MTPRHDPAGPPHHVAIIMDGNGRWASHRGHPRASGHVAGARTARVIVETARQRGVRTLTLYAFSSDNWRRPRREVTALMTLFRRYLLAETQRCVEHGIRLTILGRRDRLPSELVHAIEGAERATAGGTALQLRVAVDYSARDAILRAAAAAHAASDFTRDGFEKLLGQVDHDGGAPPVDLLVRTGGEQRLSDFLLWECAYAEFVFVRALWPDFTARDLDDALAEYAARHRRFGTVTADAPSDDEAQVARAAVRA
jgi:undecaprenyl diphosphate synthase